MRCDVFGKRYPMKAGGFIRVECNEIFAQTQQGPTHNNSFRWNLMIDKAIASSKQGEKELFVIKFESSEDEKGGVTNS